MAEHPAPKPRFQDVERLWRVNYDAFLRRAAGHANGRLDLAENFLSETILKLLLHLEREPDDIRNLKAFTFVALKNSALDHWRKNNREMRTIAADADPDDQCIDDIPIVEAMIHRDRLRAALDAIDELPDPVREVARARLLDDASYADIAEDLGITEALARKRLQLARRGLRDHLDAQENLDPVHNPVGRTSSGHQVDKNEKA